MNVKKFFTDERMSRLLRWWSVSAVYFFIGWGTRLGAQSTIIDFVFFLGISIGLFDMFVVNPIIFNMFKVKNPLRLIGMSVGQKVRYRLVYFLKVFFLVALVVVTYDIINISALSLLGLAQDKVFLPGEPIMFGIFYTIYYYLLQGISLNIKEKLKET